MKKIASLVLALAVLACAGRARADIAPQFGYVPPEYVAVPGPDGHVPVNLTPVWSAFGFTETRRPHPWAASSSSRPIAAGPDGGRDHVPLNRRGRCGRAGLRTGRPPPPHWKGSTR